MEVKKELLSGVNVTYQLRMELKQSQYSETTLLLLSTIFSKYSPQTSQIQAVEEGLSRTCVGVSPQGPLTLHRDEMTPPPLKEYSMGERLQSLGTSHSTQGRDDSSSTEGVLHQCTVLYYNYTKTYLTEMAVAPLFVNGFSILKLHMKAEIQG